MSHVELELPLLISIVAASRESLGVHKDAIVPSWLGHCRGNVAFRAVYGGGGGGLRLASSYLGVHKRSSVFTREE